MYKIIGVHVPNDSNSKDYNKIFLDILTEEPIENVKPNNDGLYCAYWWVPKTIKLSGVSSWEELIGKEVVITGTPTGKHTSHAKITEIKVIK